MFKKPSRAKNMRRKVEVTDDEPTIIEEVAVQKTTTSIAEKKKKKKEFKKTMTALSFEQEEEGEEFQVKKKTSSGRKLEIRENLISLDPTETTPSYDTETLNKLRQATPSLKSVSKEDALLHEKFPSTANSTLQTSGIPDAGAILAAKKKREQMRKGFNVTEQDDGFIALDDTEEDKTGGRLTREEDDIGDDGEAELDKYVGGTFTINQGKAKSMEKERKEGLREMIDEAEQDQSDDDIGRWEADMIKHGGARTQKKNDPFATPSNYKPAQVPQPSTLPTLTDIISSLSLATNDLTFSTEQHKQNLFETQKSMDTLKSAEKDIEKEVERGSERYDYFQGLAQYVDDLGEFLDAKLPELEDLEKEVHDMFVSETDTVVSRHYQDAMDDLSLFANVKQLDEDMEEVDEFGRVKELRNSDTARHRRMGERIKRASALYGEGELSIEEEAEQQGLWTDDEFDGNEKNTDRLNTIETNQIDTLMEEVSDEYRTLESIRTKFEAWKTTYYDDYKNAYGSLSLPGAFEFYIRLELLTWNPFSDPLEFDSMEWHRILSEYGVSPEHEDPDTEMLNKVVEKSMIKKIKNLVDTLNGRSSRQMRYASQVLEQVSYYVEPTEKAYKELVHEFVQELEKQINRMANVIETISLKTNLDQEATRAKTRFFYSNCKYLKTLALLRRQLPKDHLSRLTHTISTKIIAPLLQPNPLDAKLQKEMESMLTVFNK